MYFKVSEAAIDYWKISKGDLIQQIIDDKILVRAE